MNDFRSAQILASLEQCDIRLTRDQENKLKNNLKIRTDQPAVSNIWYILYIGSSPGQVHIGCIQPSSSPFASPFSESRPVQSPFDSRPGSTQSPILPERNLSNGSHSLWGTGSSFPSLLTPPSMNPTKPEPVSDFFPSNFNSTSGPGSVKGPAISNSKSNSVHIPSFQPFSPKKNSWDSNMSGNSNFHGNSYKNDRSMSFDQGEIDFFSISNHFNPRTSWSSAGEGFIWFTESWFCFSIRPIRNGHVSLATYIRALYSPDQNAYLLFNNIQVL